MPFSSKEKQKAYYARLEIKRLKQKRVKELLAKRRTEILALFGTVCKFCGFSDPRALQVDHINGGGHQERLQNNHSARYKLIKAHPEKYQLLCANCNWIKRCERGEVGHIK